MRALDDLGPRDFFLGLNRFGNKKMIVDQGGNYFPSSGMNTVQVTPEQEERNRFYTRLLRERGGRTAFVHLPGDVSILPNYEEGALLFVALPGEPPPHTERPATRRELRLPSPFENISTLTELFEQRPVERGRDGAFREVQPGIYRMEAR